MADSGADPPRSRQGSVEDYILSQEEPLVKARQLQQLGVQHIWTALIDNHLVIFLAAAFLVGLSLPAPGQAVSRPQVPLGPAGQARAWPLAMLWTIFLISGFRLRTDAMVGALRAPKPLVVAMVLVLLVTPCVGFATARLPLSTKEFAYGLTVFCCAPTTLTSGAALVSGCRGTDRAAELGLMVTVMTNLLGSLTMPLFLSLLLRGADVSVDALVLLVKLIVSIMLPTLVGAVCRDLIPGAADLSRFLKLPLAVISNLCLCLVIWMTVSRSQDLISSQPLSQVAACIAAGLFLHAIFWLINAPLVTCAQIQDLHDRRAVFLLASQKALPISVAVISGLDDSFGEAGLILMPVIFAHLSQLIVDSFLIQGWAKQPDEALVSLVSAEVLVLCRGSASSYDYSSGDSDSTSSES